MRPLLVLSLPNCGSGWLATVLAKSLGLRYRDGAFNPLQNPSFEAELERYFGSPLLSSYRNIARGAAPGIGECIRHAWRRDEYGLTREVFSPLKLEAFQPHFRVFVVVRALDGAFPPERATGWAIYEHAWHALSEAGYKMLASGTRERAFEAFAWLRTQLLSDAKRAGAPVVHYEALFSDQQHVANLLTDATGIEASAAAAMIVRTRRKRDRCREKRS